MASRSCAFVSTGLGGSRGNRVGPLRFGPVQSSPGSLSRDRGRRVSLLIIIIIIIIAVIVVVACQSHRRSEELHSPNPPASSTTRCALRALLRHRRISIDISCRTPSALCAFDSMPRVFSPTAFGSRPRPAGAMTHVGTVRCGVHPRGRRGDACGWWGAGRDLREGGRGPRLAGWLSEVWMCDGALRANG